MTNKPEYSIHTDIKVGSLKLVDIPQLSSQVKKPWFNQSLCEVNDCVVRLGVFQKGDFHWHKHDHEDEFFFVLEGQFVVELEDQTITLNHHQGFTVPRGIRHCTHVPEHAVILMVEGKTVTPTGD